MYTDDQLTRLAERLGCDWHYGELAEGVRGYAVRIQKKGEYVTLNDFLAWLLSPEGRCAIEDMFIERRETVYCGRGTYIDGKYAPDDYECNRLASSWKDGAEGIGTGLTPAEAWLDAAAKFTEVEE